MFGSKIIISSETEEKMKNPLKKGDKTRLRLERLSEKFGDEPFTFEEMFKTISSSQSLKDRRNIYSWATHNIKQGRLTKQSTKEIDKQGRPVPEYRIKKTQIPVKLVKDINVYIEITSDSNNLTFNFKDITIAELTQKLQSIEEII